MPIKPTYDWEQSEDEIFINVHIKGFKNEAVDIFCTDTFIKVNAPPTYLLYLDLTHEILPDEAKHYFDGEQAGLLHIRARKHEPGVAWDALAISIAPVHSSSSSALASSSSAPMMSKKEILERRKASLERAGERYNKMLEARKAQRETEARRLTEAQWDVEKQQRQTIEKRMQEERAVAEEDLAVWEEGLVNPQGTTASHTRPVPSTPGEVFALHQTQRNERGEEEAASSSGVRAVDTVRVSIDFTPKSISIPTRSRGDEEYYRQSRYKPVHIHDSPMFWKERGDQEYKSGEFKAAADSYSESIKRDGVFLTCVMNRAACYLQLTEYKRCIEDCSLALDLLANTPSSELTQDRYRLLMTKLHARRGAAFAWNKDLLRGLQDYRMAAAYSDPTLEAQTGKDLKALEKLAAEKGLEAAEGELNPFAAVMLEANGLCYKGAYQEAVNLYNKILAEDPQHTHARSNRIVALLLLGEYDAALQECHRVIQTCEEVAQALASTDGLDVADSDDDDEEEEEEAINEEDEEGAAHHKSRENRDELISKRRAASQRIQEGTSHVYLLLKAYVRGAAALCGKKDYHGAHAYLQSALRITPYDNDLADDCLRLEEKIRMETLISASTGGLSKSAASANAG